MIDWKPQPYRREAETQSISKDVLEAAITASEAVVAVHPSLPPVLTLRHLSYLSGTPYPELRRIVSRDGDEPYKVFRIRKRPRKDGRPRFRMICVPEPYLGEVQRWIAKKMLAHGRPHSASTAFAPGSTLINAAQPHCGSRWLVKIDVWRFFESISEISVYNAFRRLGYQPLVSLELARLCTRVGSDTPLRRAKRWFRRAPLHVSTIRSYAVRRLGHLPQGAASSPMLANLVMNEADIELSQLAKKFGLEYTRYADDLTFSTRGKDFSRNKAAQFIKDAYRTIGRFGLAPNLSKTQVIPPRARKVVLGLLVDQDTPRLTREFKNKMRMHLHYLERKDVGPVKHAMHRKFSAVAGLRNHLLGLAAYAAQIEPLYGAELKTRLEALSWPIVL